MYDFAVLALLALAVLKVVDFLAENVPGLHTMRSLMTFVAAIASVVVLDYSVFDGWGINVENGDFAIWLTGFIVAGLTVPWRAVFGYLTHDRAMRDETLGDATALRKAA